MKTHNFVIILAAGDLNKRLPYINHNYQSPALIPINTKPLASLIIDFYLADGNNEVFLVVNEAVRETVENELLYYKNKINIIGVIETSGVNETLQLALNQIEIKNSCIVNVVTTIPTRIIKPGEILVSPENENDIECSYIIENDKRLFFNKKENRQLPQNGNAFTGVFCVDSNILKEVVSKASTKTDLLNIVELANEKVKFTIVKDKWIDCGHEANYYDAKKELIASRSFNNIIVDSKGILTKKSSNSTKLKAEISFIDNLPAELKIYFPRIVKNDAMQNEQACVQMEYYAYPSAAELLLYWDISNASWKKFFKQISNIINDFATYKTDFSYEQFTSFYLKKLDLRISEFTNQSAENIDIVSGNYIINGLSCKNYFELLPVLKTQISDQYDKSWFCIMHGDLCFNNILYDYKSGLIKLIDARGSFGDDACGIYGDPVYDLAKLCHSAYGGYDYLVNNLYSLTIEKNEARINFLKRKNAAVIEKYCVETIEQSGYSINFINIIMATLFMSMPPLHADDKNRQKAMYLHGLYLLNKTIFDENLY